MIAFARGFPTGQGADAEEPRRKKAPDVSRPFRLDVGQWMALIGSSLLGISLLLPFLRYHGFNGPSLNWQAFPVSWSPRLRHDTFALVCYTHLLILTFLSAVSAIKRWSLGLWLTGFAAYMVVALACLGSINYIGALDCGEVAEVDPGHGCYVAIVGILLLFGGALVDGILDSKWPAYRRRADDWHTAWRRSEPWWVNLPQRVGPFGEG
jgi:hypothetical protein